MSDWFRIVAERASKAVGSSWAFLIAIVVVLAWAITGPLFNYSDTWQLIINTGTTIITFLMVFLIQNAQFRDSEAIHVKLDELIRAIKDEDNALLDLEDLDQEKIDRIRKKYQEAAIEARSHVETLKDVKN